MRMWLREIRLKLHYSEKFVADAAGIVQPFYHHIETGEKNPSVETAKKIAAVLGFDWTRFFEDIEEGA